MGRRARTTIALLVGVGLACAVELAWRIAVPPSAGAWDICAEAQASVLAASVAWALAQARREQPILIPVAVAVGAAVLRALLVVGVMSAWLRHPGILLGACLGPCSQVDDVAARSWIWFGQLVLEGYGLLFAPLAAVAGAWAGRAMWTRASADVPVS